MAATITSQRHDAPLVDLLRQRDKRRVDDLAKGLGITATAVRQRLDRLMKEGLVSREVIQGTRGRPSHSYNLTESGNRSAGDNFQDLSVVLWGEIRSVRDPAIRRGLLDRIGSSLADRFASKVSGKTPSERLQSVANVMKDREIPCSFSIENGLPILTSLACPYPELAELDRGICAAERSMLETLSGGRVRLSECRLDGASCCRFTGDRESLASSPEESVRCATEQPNRGTAESESFQPDWCEYFPPVSSEVHSELLQKMNPKLVPIQISSGDQRK